MMNNVDYKREIIEFWQMGFLSTNPKSFDPWIYQIPVELTVHTYANVSLPKYINFIWKYLSLVSSELVKQEFLFCLNLLQWDGNSLKECYTIKPDVLKGGFWDTMNFGTELICVKGLSHESLVSDIRIQKDHGVSFRPPSDDFKLFN